MCDGYILQSLVMRNSLLKFCIYQIHYGHQSSWSRDRPPCSPSAFFTRTSYQIRKIVGFAPGMVVTFPRHRGIAIPTCTTASASRTCCDACRDCKRVVSFEFGGRENAPGIPGACETRKFRCLVRGPWVLLSSYSCRYEKLTYDIFKLCISGEWNWI